MKTAKLIFLIFLLMGVNAISQEDRKVGRIDFYAGFDVMNATVGGKTLNTGERRNSRALDFKGGWNLSYDWWRFGTYLEIFPTIDYFAMGLQFGTPIRIENGLDWIEIGFLGIDTYNWQTDVVIIPSLETQMVWRDGLPEESIPNNVTIKEASNWSLSLEIQFDQIIKDSPLYVSIEGTLTYRHDKYNIWGRQVDPSGTFPALWENRAVYLKIGCEIFRN